MAGQGRASSMPVDAYQRMAQEARILSRLVRRDARVQDWTLAERYLNGAVADLLRSEVVVAERRRHGTFFTGELMGRQLVQSLGPLTSEDVIVDPNCGAGDLLLRCAEALPLCERVDQTIHAWTRSLVGIEIQPRLVELARDRLTVLAARRHEVPLRGTEPKSTFFNKLVADDYTDQIELLASATVIAANPPFVPFRLQSPRDWGSGKVNLAAIVIDDVLKTARDGCRVGMIVPEVLRSGSRYEKWRSAVGDRMGNLCFRSLGRFDKWTDVDVALMLGTVGTHEREPPPSTSEDTVGHKFQVAVGPLVEYRDPKLGAWRSVVRSRNLAKPLGPKRRYLGSAEGPPFLAISRTSSPTDSPRVKGKVFETGPPLVVENHVIILRDPGDDPEKLRKLLEHLQSDETTDWLNRHLRLRHLTVSMIRKIPLRFTRAHA